jgi:hypothetical protein
MQRRVVSDVELWSGNVSVILEHLVSWSNITLWRKITIDVAAMSGLHIVAKNYPPLSLHP